MLVGTQFPPEVKTVATPFASPLQITLESSLAVHETACAG